MAVQETLRRVDKRTQTKLAMIEELAQRSKNKPNGPRKTALLLLQCLRDFADRQSTFFHRGFSGSGVADIDGERLQGGFLSEPDVIYPLEYALAHTEQQVNHDLDVFLRIIAHRDEHVGTKDLRDRLALADQLAYLALQPAIDVGLITPASALTYFQKSATIRIIPYAPMALVGIPFTTGSDTAKDNPRDYLMIPHEIGHQIYWRLAKPDQDKPTNSNSAALPRNVGAYIQQKFIQEKFSPSSIAVPANQPIWLQNWNEEIFADVYGCLIGGAASARTLQELLKGVPVNVFVDDDGEHPSPIVRPYIHIHLLESIANTKGVTDELKLYLNTQAQNLRADWESWLTDHNIPRWLRPAGVNDAISLVEAEKLVNQVVDGILASELKDLVESAASNSKILWDVERKPPEDIGPRPEINFNVLPLGPVSDLEDLGNGRFRFSDNSASPGDFSFSPLETKFGFERLREDALTKEGFTPPPGRSPWWLEVLEAGGWTEGPTGPGGFKTGGGP
jgi:hypothetical protein